MPRTPPRAALVLRRGLLCRCPVCGRGRVFVRGVTSARSCDACGWLLERCVGHWIGGNEINAVATFSAGVVAYVAAALAFGLGPVSVWIATAVTGVFGVAFYRPSRGLFFALDYLLDRDPTSDSALPPDGRDEGAGPPDPAGPPPARSQPVPTVVLPIHGWPDPRSRAVGAGSARPEAIRPPRRRRSSVREPRL